MRVGIAHEAPQGPSHGWVAQGKRRNGTQGSGEGRTSYKLGLATTGGPEGSRRTTSWGAANAEYHEAWKAKKRERVLQLVT